MPALVGQSERTARLRVGEDGIEIVAVSEFRSPDYTADAVVSQDPSAGVSRRHACRCCSIEASRPRLT